MDNDYIYYTVWDEIIYPFPNLNVCTVKVLESISNFIPYITEYVITFSMMTLKLIHVSKRGP